MVVQITRAVAAQLLAEAAASPEREVCGLLFGTPERIDAALPCRNVADIPACTFEIDPQALITAHKVARAGGPQIIGCYHSHPNGRPEPSETDRAIAEGNDWLWAIVAGGALRVWRAERDGFVGMEHKLL